MARVFEISDVYTLEKLKDIKAGDTPKEGFLFN